MHPVTRLFRTFDSLGPLVLRALLAAVFIYHGGQKAFGWFGGKGWAATQAQWAAPAPEGFDLPAWLAAVAMVAEIAGAGCVALGLLTRPAALALFCTMTVAILKVHLPNGFFGPNGCEYPAALAAMALALVFLGGGKLSVDRGLSRTMM